jgi:hypothetical protein
MGCYCNYFSALPLGQRRSLANGVESDRLPASKESDSTSDQLFSRSDLLTRQFSVPLINERRHITSNATEDVNLVLTKKS